jgi:hypothetical protein
MEVLSLIIAVIALVIAVAAFMRTGGVRELKRQVQALSILVTFGKKTLDGNALILGLRRFEPFVDERATRSMPTGTPAEGVAAGVAERTPLGRSRRG